MYLDVDNPNKSVRIIGVFSAGVKIKFTIKAP